MSEIEGAVKDSAPKTGGRLPAEIPISAAVWERQRQVKGKVCSFKMNQIMNGEGKAAFRLHFFGGEYTWRMR